MNGSFLSAQYMRDLSLPFPPIHQGVTASSSLRTVHVLGIPVLALSHLLTVPFASQHGSSHEIWQMCPPYNISPSPTFTAPFPYCPGNTAWQLSILIPAELQRDGWINTEGRRQKERKSKATQGSLLSTRTGNNLPAIRTSFCILLWRGAICVPKRLGEGSSHIF